MLLAAVAWLTCAVASEPEEPESAAPPAVPESSSFAAALERAKQAYFEGRSAEAFGQFQRLELRLKSVGETPPWSEAAEAMTWLAEIHYTRGDVDKAEETFRWILERDLDTAMLSPYHHPIEVVSLFEEVRGDVANERQTDATGEETDAVVAERGRPAWTYLPFGVPQLSQGRTGVGVTFLVMQAGFGITSIVTYAQLREFNQDPGTNPSDAQQEEFQDEYWRRRVVQNTFFGLFVASVVVNVIDAGAAWKKEHPRTTVTLGPTPAGVPGLTFHGTL